MHRFPLTSAYANVTGGMAELSRGLTHDMGVYGDGRVYGFMIDLRWIAIPYSREKNT